MFQAKQAQAEVQQAKQRHAIIFQVHLAQEQQRHDIVSQAQQAQQRRNSCFMHNKHKHYQDKNVKSYFKHNKQKRMCNKQNRDVQSYSST